MDTPGTPDTAPRALQWRGRMNGHPSDWVKHCTFYGSHDRAQVALSESGCKTLVEITLPTPMTLLEMRSHFEAGAFDWATLLPVE